MMRAVRPLACGPLVLLAITAGLIATAGLLAPAWAQQITTSKGIHWRMPVTLRFDPETRRLSGQSIDKSGRATAIAITLPRLTETVDLFAGYLDQSGGLIPPSAKWLPDLPPSAAGWNVTIQTPAGYLAVPYPGGDVIQTETGGGTSFHIHPLIARAPLIIGQFELQERLISGVKVRTFFTKQNARLADSYLDAAGEAIGSLSQRIGPYPYEAFAIVESPLPVGVGYPGYTLVSGRILPLPFMRGRSLWHEIAHVWWGNGVFVDYNRGNWAEGFAAFFADYALAEAAHNDREHRYDWLLEYEALPESADYPLRQFITKSHGQSQAIGYGKAAMVLVMLREKVGVQAFDAGVKRFWKQNKFKITGWAEIETSFQAETTVPLAAFFKRWLDAPGALPATANDPDFLTFRALADNESIQTLRSFLSSETVAIEALPSAPASINLGKPAAPDGYPVLIGSRADLQGKVMQMPPAGVAAIWATKDKQGRNVIAIDAADTPMLRKVVTIARHYGRWSWLVIQGSDRPKRGRWPIGE